MSTKLGPLFSHIIAAFLSDRFQHAGYFSQIGDADGERWPLFRKSEVNEDISIQLIPKIGYCGCRPGACATDGTKVPVQGTDRS
jgi:hypothetical protein